MQTKTMDARQHAALEAAIRGETLFPGGDGYEAARQIFNAMIDRRPAAIVRCADTEDVVAAVKFARREGFEVSVRSGGHGVSGSALGDGVLTIDLSAMRGMAIDPAARTARVEAGVLWGDLDSATQAHGLAVTGGRVASTGVAGLTLGSGSGWLERTVGFTCDNLLEVTVVTADGSVVRADDSENSDLFWGVRGGGGNFGIVTAFTFRLHPVGPTILAGVILHRFEDAPAALRAYRDFMKTAPDEIGGAFSFANAGPNPGLPEEIRGKTIAVIIIAWFGPLDEAEAALAPLRAIGRPLADLVRPMGYTELQRMSDAANPHGMRNYYKADFLDALGDAAIDTIVARVAEITSPLTALILQPLGGALARVPAASTPLGRRDAAYAYHALAVWAGGPDEPHIAWARNFSDSVQPFATAGVYLTYSGEEGEQKVKEAYGPEKYARLVALKDRYDPDNFFRRNPNIRPSRGVVPTG